MNQASFHRAPEPVHGKPTGQWMPVEPIHCHKRKMENTLIESVRLVSDTSLDAEVKFRFVPEELPFFFDHPIDHLPGMVEVCAMRQLSLAVCHVLYDVPQHYVALLGWMKIKFHCYSDLNLPTTADMKVVDSKIKRHRSVYVMDAVMRQGDTKLMRCAGEVIMMHPLLAKKFSQSVVSVHDHEGDLSRAFTW